MLILILLIISFFLAAGINSTVPLFMGIIASLLILSAKLVGKKEDEELKDKYLPKKLPGEKEDERDIKDILKSLDRRITNIENYLLRVQPPQQPGIEFQPVQPEKQEEVQEQEKEREMEKEKAEPEPEEQEKEQEVEEPQAAGMSIKTGGKLTIAVPEEPGLLTEHWKKIQQQFIENWTGILGSIIMVMGVAFLGIYTALKLSPVYRFVMLVVFSALLLGLFFFLKSKPKWERLALWLRSGAGAIFLFACLGASTIDGLKWVDHPLRGTGLVLLLMGIVLNLYLSFIGGNQVFASLHVLLSLVALSIAPPTTITFIAAAIVTLFGIALTYREKWEYHLLLTISLFFAYHLYWYYQNGMTELSRAQHLTGIIAVAAVSVLALLVHYRSLYRTAVFERLPFFVHFSNWVYFGIGLYVHSMGSPWKPVVIGCGSIAAFLLARQARRLEIRWLFITDTLAAQAIALFALFSMAQWKVNPFFILGMMLLETLIFLVIMMEEKENLLAAVGTAIKYALGTIMIAWAFTSGIAPAPGNMAAVYPFLVTLLAAAVFGTVFHFYLLKILKKYDEAPLKKQEINWQNFSIFFIHAFYVGIAAYLYFLDWTWKPPAIAVLSITGFLVAKQCKTMEIKWLYQTGILLAQAAALMALISLSQWQVETYFSYTLMFIETLLFLVLLLKEKETRLRRIGFSILFIIAVVLTAAALGNIHNTDTGTLCQYAIAFLVCTAAGTVFYIYTFRQFGETIASFKITPTGSDTTYSISAIGILLGWLLLAAFINTYQIPWWEYILAAAGIALIAVRRRYPSKGLGIGLMMFVLGFHAFGWNNMSLTDHLPVMKKIIYSLPFLMLSFSSIKMPLFNRWEKTAKAYGIYWFYLHLMVASYYIFTRVSPNITGVLWLAFSIITLETIYWLQKRHGERMPEKGEPDRFLLHMAYLLIGAFLIRHLVVHLHITEYLGIFRVRFLMALGAIVTFIYWTLRQLPERENSAKMWMYVHPLFLDLIFVFSVFTVVVEVNSHWFPLTWIAAALVCLIGAGSSTGEPSRIRFYSLLLYWASTVYVALIPGTSGSTALHLYEKPWFIDSTAILLQFVYIVLIHKLTFLEGIRFPKLLGFLSPLSELINRRKNLWVHYPLFISVALFLYQTFDKSILTLLWVVECFLIFIAAVILKENHFRYLAMTGLALTLIRLVFYDLAKSDTFTRALVFISVGILMLVMNSIYNKYKDRF